MANKFSKRIVILIALVLIGALAFTLAACNDKKDDKKDPPKTVVTPQNEGKYTVGVYYEDGSPVEGAGVQLCVVENDELGMCYPEQPTGADGISVQEYPENEMEVHILTCPEGYRVREDCKNQRIKKGESADVYLEEHILDPSKAYTVRVLTPEGNPVVGVTLRLTLKGTQNRQSMTTDETGTVVMWFEDDTTGADCSVEIYKNILPEGYEAYKAPDLSQMLAKQGQTLTITLEENTTVQRYSYTVAISYPDNSAASGVNVTFVDALKGTHPAQTGADGRATVRIATPGRCSVEINDLPNGYICKSQFIRVAQGATTNVSLTRVYDYKIKLLYPDGTPVVGANVDFVDSTTVENPATTGQDGVASVTIEAPGACAVAFNDIPSGYIVKNAVAVEAGATIEVRLTKVYSYRLVVLRTNGLGAEGVSVTFMDRTNAAHQTTTNADGVAEIEIEPDGECRYQIAGVPKFYLLSETTGTVEAGVSKDIKLADDLSLLFVPSHEYATPSDGSGSGRYATSGATQGQIVSGGFDPYVIAPDNYYKFSFSKNRTDGSIKKIYLQLNCGTKDYGVYKIYSEGNVDASVQIISGDPVSALFNGGRNAVDNDDRPEFNDNKDGSTRDFYLEFSNNESTTAGKAKNGVVYFELALETESHLGREFAVRAERIGDYTPKPPVQWTEIHATGELQPAPAGDGPLHTIPLDASSFEVVRDSDGHYYLGEGGPMLYAMMSTSAPWPWGVTGEGDMALTFALRNSYGNLNQWSTDGVTGENWQPLLEEYSAVTNADGYYPVNDEIAAFMKHLYADMNTQATYFAADNLAGVTWNLPRGNEWIFLCGYYGEEYTGPDYAAGDGSESNPYNIAKRGNFAVTIPANGEVFYITRGTFDVVLNTEGATLSYGVDDFKQGQVCHIVPAEDVRSPEFFLISNDTASELTVSFTVRDGMRGKGTEDEPYEAASIADAFSFDTTASNASIYIALSPLTVDTVYTLTTTTATGKFKFVVNDYDDDVFTFVNGESNTCTFTLKAYVSYIVIVSDPTAGGASLNWTASVDGVITAQTLPQGGVDEETAPVLSAQTLTGQAHKVEFAVGSSNAQQWWQFVAPAGTTLVISPAVGLTITIQYFDADGILHSLSSDSARNNDDGAVDSNGRITISLYEGATYYLIASASAGVYDLTFEAKTGGKGSLTFPGSDSDHPILLTLEAFLAMTSVDIPDKGEFSGTVWYSVSTSENVTLTLTAASGAAVIIVQGGEDYYSTGKGDENADTDLTSFTLHAGVTYLVSFTLNGAGGGTLNFTVARG